MVKQQDSDLTLAFHERHPDGNVSVTGGEAMAMLKEFTYPFSSRSNRHNSANDFTALLFLEFRLFLQSPYVLPIACVVSHRSPHLPTHRR
jgi:hypothetical protein